MMVFGLLKENMINMYKKIFLFCLIILFNFESNAQGKFGIDEQKCKENLSMFREYYKQGNFLDAYGPWMWAFKNCPQASQNIYKNGPKIVKAKIKTDNNNKLQHIDTLMMIFDQRIQYFGKEGYVLGLKGYELLGVDKSRSEEALEYLKISIDLDGNKSSVQAVYGYMKAMVNLEKSKLRSSIDVLNAYSIVSEIIDYNIINESKSTKYFIQYSQKVEDLFTPYAKCDDLISLFSQKYNPQIDDINLLKKIVKLLSNKECTDSDLFFSASNRLFELEPSASSAYQMSKMSISKGKISDAITFAKQAIDSEENSSKKAKYYLVLADAYRSQGSYSSARQAVNNALSLRSNWGEAYISLGNIYIAGAKSCGTDFESQTVYWIAVDAFIGALSDPNTKSLASKNINTYSKYFPNKETCFFNGVNNGSNYEVKCWINKSTKVRTSD
jgi:tetratricopeptide (TPR) repeat protein